MSESRTRYRERIVQEQDEVAALCYIGDGIHRLAKAAEMLLDPEAVASHRFNAERPLSVVEREERAA